MCISFLFFILSRICFFTFYLLFVEGIQLLSGNWVGYSIYFVLHKKLFFVNDQFFTQVDFEKLCSSVGFVITIWFKIITNIYAGFQLLKNCEVAELMHCLKRSLMVSQLIFFSDSFRPLWALLFKFKQKRKFWSCSGAFKILSLDFQLNQDTKSCMHNQNELELLHYTDVYLMAETIYFFSKKFRIDVWNFLMTCKIIDSPDRSLSSLQPRHTSCCYCLVCIVPYNIKTSLFSFCF